MIGLLSRIKIKLIFGKRNYLEFKCKNHMILIDIICYIGSIHLE